MTPEELRARRQRLDLSQAELAAALQTTPNTVARWERGEIAIRMPGMLRYILTEMERDKPRVPPGQWREHAATWLDRREE